MNSLDEQLEAIIAIFRAQGSAVAIDPYAPEDVKRAFLEMLLTRADGRQAVVKGMPRKDAPAGEEIKTAEKQAVSEVH